MIKIFIDDKPFEVEEGITVFTAATQAGIEIPHFCYHPAFAPEGTCRMCLIEIEGVPKLELACAAVVREGMKVSTSNERVVEGRKGVLEFLLVDHPMDCPICDQAGDCKLQDYYEKYGMFESKSSDAKEKRDKKRKIGQKLIHDQERCVLCRRCVRFTREVTKTQELGVFERGIHAEINILENRPVDNKYSGNLAQICPVGAITDTDFRFQTRSWFLKSGDSICPLCSRGCSITVESHKGFSRFKIPKRVYRIRSRRNPDINGFWICDIGRYGYGYINENRLGQILSKNKQNGVLNWESALKLLSQKMKEVHPMDRTSGTVLLLNSWLTNEELFLIKKFLVENQEFKNVYLIDIPDGEGDDFLITTERSPNKRGLKELGLKTKSLSSDSLPEKIKLVLAFCPPNIDSAGIDSIKAVFDQAETKVLFASNESELSNAADLVLPTAVIAEKAGSLINIDGMLQKFSPALELPGVSRPEWQILVEMAKEIDTHHKYYDQFLSPEEIFLEIRKEISDFGKKSD
ncbi:MAG: 2Fe-2S iron-sulfur cluster-binding protein [Candidatus Aminicenantes bacterium]|nr:2Fe-2S iron-sulfur cluster-binding protein [Candidatus Aminicenantes bacterium]